MYAAEEFKMSYTEIHEDYDYDMERLEEALLNGDVSAEDYENEVDWLNELFNARMEALTDG